ncbi:hypothetical protein PG997_008767 [Apiospora hydei]|uniref:Lysine-specific metallo-endopeptidase domain-containing protein n=1 Tax=Apiospora hydei TaxID=1337664 RepID=A0ABR1WBQ9_9PEZI
MLFPLLLLVTGCLATYDVVCHDAAGSARIEAAIQEAIQVAENAQEQILDLDDGVVKAAFTPLFRPSDVIRLDSLYGSVVNIASGPLHVTFYCRNDFINLYDDGNGAVWSDTDYTYVDAQGTTQNIARYKVADGNRAKPGGANGDAGSFSTSGSYNVWNTQWVITHAYSRCTAGFKLKLPGDANFVADFSKQAHVFVSKKRWDPPNDGLDHRSLTTIHKDGLLEGKTALDHMKPLSETILHELMHIFGGTTDEFKGTKRISDNPVTPVITDKIYGYEKCVLMNQHRDDTVFVATSASPLTRADCPTILAKALYLQIRGQPTYWGTGIVDRDTLQPIGIQPQTGNARRAERILRRIGVPWFA